MAGKLEQLKVDKDGNIFKVEAGVLPEATHNLARKALNIAACVEDAYADTVKKALAKCNQHTPTRASGYVVLIRWLQSALIPFVTTQASGY